MPLIGAAVLMILTAGPPVALRGSPPPMMAIHLLQTGLPLMPLRRQADLPPRSMAGSGCRPLGWRVLTGGRGTDGPHRAASIMLPDNGFGRVHTIVVAGISALGPGVVQGPVSAFLQTPARDRISCGASPRWWLALPSVTGVAALPASRPLWRRALRPAAISNGEPA